jgi:hypothetical protein
MLTFLPTEPNVFRNSDSEQFIAFLRIYHIRETIQFGPIAVYSINGHSLVQLSDLSFFSKQYSRPLR